MFFEICRHSRVKVMSNTPNSEVKPMRNLTLAEVHSVVKYLQGMTLTQIEATITDPVQRKAQKDIFNNNVSRCLSEAQDIAWRWHDSEDGKETVLPENLR